MGTKSKLKWVLGSLLLFAFTPESQSINEEQIAKEERERERENKRGEELGLVVVSKKSCWFWF